VHPPKEIAARLGLDDGETAVARRRFRYVDDIPYGISISYFPLAIVRGSEIVEPTDIERGANRVLAELGHEQVRYVDQITARMPASDEVSALEIPAGTPIHEHVRIGYDADDLAVRVAVSVLPSDKHIIQYELSSGS
jgi:GntR family transcriptional regulator